MVLKIKLFQRMELIDCTKNYFLDLWTNYGNIIIAILVIVGILKCLSMFLRFLCFIWSYYLRPQQNLIKKYGKCWAMITGGSEGIGEAIARELASQGFNILLVSRSREKLEKAVHNILRDFPGVECEFLTYDFNQRVFNEEKLKPLIDQFVEKDIGILVNNVGTAKMTKFDECKYEDIDQIMNVNVISMTYLTHAALPYLLRRSKKSLLVFISSMAADVIPPFMTMYSASKSYVRCFAETLAREMRERIDITVISPGGVLTRLHPSRMILDIDLKSVGPHYLSHFGRDVVSCGHPKHLLQTKLFLLFPASGMHKACLQKVEYLQKNEKK